MDEQNDYVDFNIIDIASDDIKLAKIILIKVFQLHFMEKRKKIKM